jgi:beta-lactamase regulating signal transducer with metallopeptidase domain
MHTRMRSLLSHYKVSPIRSDNKFEENTDLSVPSSRIKSSSMDSSVNYSKVSLILLIIGIVGIIGFSLYEANVFERFTNNKEIKQKKHEFNNTRIVMLLFLLVLLYIASCM